MNKIKSVDDEIVLKQLIKAIRRTTTISSTIIDHILASYPERFTQCGVMDISLSDHQTKRGSHKQIQFLSFKHYTVDLFEQELS